MRILYTCFAFFVGLIAAQATVHNVEVGGLNPSIPPYFLPQEITINVGDTVRWTWVTGTHNVTSITGPVPFASPDFTAPATYEVEFLQAGVWTYHCDDPNDSGQQNGRINVGTANNIPTATLKETNIYPTLTSDFINVELPTGKAPVTATIINAVTGQEIFYVGLIEQDSKIDVSSLANGIYFLRLVANNEESIIKRIVVQR